MQENCTCLDNASILFINTNLLLEHRKDWRFLYSSQTHARSLEVSSVNLFAIDSLSLSGQELMSRVLYKGPTVLVVRDAEGNVFGAHASTSWC